METQQVVAALIGFAVAVRQGADDAAKFVMRLLTPLVALAMVLIAIGLVANGLH